jgi:hypothetical protein
VTKNAKAVSLAGIAAAVLLVLLWFARDVFLRRQGSHDCEDGPRFTIDIRDFNTQYSAYSVELEATFADKAKLSAKLSPTQLQQLSEAMQSAREFRRYVVPGYNSCAVTKAQYSQYGAKFQALDNLAREINELTGKTSLSPEETAKLAGLISQYGDLARKLGTE